MSRHSAPRSEPWLIAVAFAAVLAAVVAAVTAFGAPASEAGDTDAACSPRDLRLDAAPEIATVLQQAVADRGCDGIIVGAVPAVKVLGHLVDRTDVPDLWVPDSSSWLSRLGPAGADVAATVSAPSLATSPVVVAASSGTTPASWGDVLAAPGFLGGDPLTSATSATPLLGARAEESDQRALAGLLVPVAQRFAGGEAKPEVSERLAAVAASGGSTVASEQAVLAGKYDGVEVSAPVTGTAFLDYPLVVTAVQHRREAGMAAQWLERTLTEPTVRRALADAGFRGPDGAPLDGRGAGRVTPLEMQPAEVPQVLRLWARLALPTRALAVFDVSGSMGFASGRSTRMGLTTAAARAGVGLFPDAAAIGVWRFSQGLDGDRDYEQMLPIRRLDASVGAGEQRDALLAALDRMSYVPGTATGLYDTALAAFQHVQASYDPHAVNSVILFTDGRNEDPGSISLQQLLADLARLQKPTEPVGIITIGISDDADARALRKISAATGGTSYVARDPQDIGTVFRQALSARVP